MLKISFNSEPKMLYIARDIAQGNLKSQTQIEYLIDVRPSTQCGVAFIRFLLVDIDVQFDDRIKLFDEPCDV